ncbi:MAG: SDR family oxidoreductase [Pirellulales bacterium]|nr:SDR family oxidoreductase [Pirellulales bacterium]
MDSGLRGKSALITGGSSGIGRGIAEVLAAEGVNLALASRGVDHAVVEDLKALGGDVHSIQADVSREDDVKRMVAEAAERLNGLDYFVNNAARAHHQPLTQIDAETFRSVIDTNLAACVWGCREAARHLISQKKPGAIVVVGSTSMYTPGPAEAVYRISKVGLKSLVETMAVELAPHGIRVNLLVPGHYRTRLTAGIPADIEAKLRQEIPLRRFGQPLDCGHAAAFLLSPILARYVTGAELVVDGGLSLRPIYFGDDEQLKALNEMQGD